MTGKTAFITGGASGIGLGIARALLDAGMRVVIADVRLESLDAAQAELHHPALHALQLDVTDRAAMALAALQVQQWVGPLHLLCCNAGIGDIGYIKHARYEDWDWITSVTLGGVINTVHSFLPGMRAHGETAHVMATASMAGLTPLNHGGIYSVAKAAVVGMMEALRMELTGTPIGVSVLCPGMTRTGIGATTALRPEKFRYPGFQPRKSSTANSPPPDFMKLAMSPEEVGRRVLRGVRRNDLYILPHNEFGEAITQLFDEMIALMPPPAPTSAATSAPPRPAMPTPYRDAVGKD